MSTAKITFFRFLVEISPRPELVSWLGPIVSGVPVQVIPMAHAITLAPNVCRRPENQLWRLAGADRRARPSRAQGRSSSNSGVM